MDKLRSQFLSLPLESVAHPASRRALNAAAAQKVEAQKAPAVSETQIDAQQWFERGFNSTDPDEQIRYYSKAIRLAPDYYEAFNNRESHGTTRATLTARSGTMTKPSVLSPSFTTRIPAVAPFFTRNVITTARSEIIGRRFDWNQGRTTLSYR